MDFNKEGLTRQGSVYNLTFDEFQSSMGGVGKDFGSMNMDELLKNIWTAEESQAMAAANPAPPPGGGGIQRQGSLSLPRTLSQKTVDEVWRDLVRENTNTGNNGVERVSVVERNVISNNGNSNNNNNNNPGRQQTLGEMTLEEFLVRAGVDINLSNQVNNNNNINNTANNNINPSNNMNNTINTTNNASSSNTSLFFSNTTLPVMPMPIPIQAYSTHQVMTLPTNGMMPCVNTTTKNNNNNNNNNINNNGNNGEMSSSLSPVGYSFGGGGKKGGGPVEKVVERRQRRMIKNRESAARSRARKQAYTIELEAEVAKLKEQNEELQKKQQEIMEMQKNQSMEKINPQQSGPKKRCLRRTQTGPW